ncbi:arsenate reductase ArsC [Deinococcus ruber]|uniref:Arsenate reductase n=1 Tax=Deinococcus ruber TaxID=1848197 RepID=A0A918FA23_9DEIO|nr:arsenate reductase ArsC [Deinococcus ruber]GGR14886.1 arsenate reductase [Deinococcus ruber]
MLVLILCTHNSARSQMGEGWLRYHASALGLKLDIVSAGTAATRVQPEAVQVMAELGIDLTLQTSKALSDLPRPLEFDVVITVSATAAEHAPEFPPHTVRRHYPFEDPSGGTLDRWRELRRQINVQMQQVAQALATGQALPPSRAHAEPLGMVKAG